jgi:uncharacterized protein (TIGR01440 family)
MNGLDHVAQGVETILSELVNTKHLGKGQIVVIGASTSEVMGKRIGTAGAEDVAREIYKGIEAVRQKYGFYTVFQCCEHLNRALVVERPLLERASLVEVSAVPVPKAGGSMAAYAFSRFADACLVENIQADAGIDIGDTFIGMHLRPVAIPLRPSIRQIGQAHVTMAHTRPKLIGGPRAVYAMPEVKINDSNHCE